MEKLCSFFLLDIQNHSWRASGQEGLMGIGSGCEVHSARTRHNTTCIKQGYKTSARRLPLESLARGCSGSRFFCVPGYAVQGRNSRAPSPVRPSFDPDHTLPFVLSPHFRKVGSLSSRDTVELGGLSPRSHGLLWRSIVSNKHSLSVSLSHSLALSLSFPLR